MSDGFHMFDLKKPCSNCPFTKSHGPAFGLDAGRIMEIVTASAFPCHKTVDYDATSDSVEGDEEPETKYKSKGPIQCAGLMSILTKVNMPNQIMQVAERMGYLTCADLDGSDTFDTIEELLDAHAGIQKP